MRRNFAAVNRWCGIRGYEVRGYGGAEFGGYGGAGVRWCGIRGYGGAGVREHSFRKSKSPNPEHQSETTTATRRGSPPCLPACPQARQEPPKKRADTGVCPYRWKPRCAHTAGSHDAPYRWKRGSRLPKKRCYAGLRHCFLEKKDRFFNQ